MVKQSFLDRMNAGQVLVSDGATGTNLQRSGLPVGVVAEAWVLDNKDEIFRLHQSFIQAGADILLTCTFGATRLRLDASNLADQCEAINRRAVEITRAAVADQDVYVAGSIGPLGHMLAPLGDVSVAEAEANYREQAALLCEGGVDLIVIETQFDINEAGAAVRGVRAVAPTIPLVCSFSYDRGIRTMMGVKPADMAAQIGAMDVDILGINCGRSLDENLSALEALRAATGKPLWFKPNAGLPDLGPDGEPTYSVTPEAMGAMVPAWIDRGAQVVGGCCGTSPEHLAQIARAVHD